MELLVIFVSLLVFVLIAIILSPIGKAVDSKAKRLDKITSVNTKVVDEELTKPLFERFIAPIIFSILKTVSKILPKSKEKKKSNSQLATELKLAGMKITDTEFSAIRGIFAIVVIGISFLPMLLDSMQGILKFLSFLIGVIVAVVGPRYYLKSAVKRRQEKIREQLPDMLDLLAVSVEAGLGFDSAISRVTMQTKGALTEEFKTVYREMQLGRPKREALRELSQRSTVEELKVFVSSIIQADQLGISIKNVLNNQSKQLRLTRKQRAQEKALKAPVKMTIPLVIFIFPVIFIILLGPSLMQIMGVVGG